MEYDELPDSIKELIEQFSDETADPYQQCSELVKTLNNVGWTCNYGLDAIPHNFRKFKIKK